MLKIIIPNKGSYCYNLHYHTNTDPPSIDLGGGGSSRDPNLWLLGYRYAQLGRDSGGASPHRRRELSPSRQEARPKGWEPE